MTGIRPLVAVLTALAGLAFLVPEAKAAQGATTPSITVVSQQVQGRVADIVVEAHGLAPGQSLSTTGVQALLDGQPAAVTVTDAVTAAFTRTVVIVIDTSGSMAGAPITAAKTAAAGYLDALPPDVRVGLVSFADQVHQQVAPTTDRQAVRLGLSGLQAGGETRLYDALIVAAASAGGSGQRQLLLLSDGGDTRSAATLAQAAADLRAAGEQLDVIPFHTSDSFAQALTSLASSTGGVAFPAADSTRIGAAFSAAADTYVPRFTLEVQLGSRAVSTTLPLVLSVGSGAGILSTTLQVKVPGGIPAGRQPGATRALKSSPLSAGIWIAAGLLALGLFGMLVVALDVRGNKAHSRRLAGIRAYQTAPISVTPMRAATPLRGSRVGKGVLWAAEDLVRSRGLEQRIRPLLDRAGWSLRSGEFVLLCGAAGLGLLVVLAVTTGQVLLGLLVGMPLGLYGTVAAARFAAARRCKAFVSELPDSLQLIASALSAGFSFTQALDNLVRTGKGPLVEEIGRALAQSRLGVPIEDSLDAVAVRMGSDDFAWAVMAVRVQREVGGNLAQILDTVTETLRERERLRRQVQALSAEGRLSAYILIALPILMAIYLFAVRRTYIRPLYTQPAGIVMLAGAVFLLVLGWVVMRKTVQVEL